MNILGYELEKTCETCPEQYDVFKDGKAVGYLRLRHGYFYAETKGITVYDADTKGDGLFEIDERMFHLELAIRAIDLYLRKLNDTNN